MTMNRPKQDKRVSLIQIELILFLIGLLLIVTAVRLFVIDAKQTASAEDNRLQLAQGRKPATIELTEDSSKHLLDSRDHTMENWLLPKKQDLPLVDEMKVDVHLKAEIADEITVGDDLKARDRSPMPAYVEDLDEQTLSWYEKIHADYPDFKGWIELPYWEISYPIFVDEEDPFKYERMTRDGEFSYLGEVNYQGDPWTSHNLIVFGHSLYDMSGFSKIDNLPEENLASLPREAKKGWIDLLQTGERREYTMIQAAYYPRADTSWAFTDFVTDVEWEAYLQEKVGLEEEPAALLTLATCKDAVGDYKAVIHAIPG